MTNIKKLSSFTEQEFYAMLPFLKKSANEVNHNSTVILKRASYLPVRPDNGGLYLLHEDKFGKFWKQIYLVHFGRTNSTHRVTGDEDLQIHYGGMHGKNNLLLSDFSLTTGMIPLKDTISDIKSVLRFNFLLDAGENQQDTIEYKFYNEKNQIVGNRILNGDYNFIGYSEIPDTAIKFTAHIESYGRMLSSISFYQEFNPDEYRKSGNGHYLMRYFNNEYVYERVPQGQSYKIKGKPFRFDGEKLIDNYIKCPEFRVYLVKGADKRYESGKFIFYSSDPSWQIQFLRYTYRRKKNKLSTRHDFFPYIGGILDFNHKKYPDQIQVKPTLFNLRGILPFDSSIFEKQSSDNPNVYCLNVSTFIANFFVIGQDIIDSPENEIAFNNNEWVAGSRLSRGNRRIHPDKYYFHDAKAMNLIKNKTRYRVLMAVRLTKKIEGKRYYTNKVVFRINGDFSLSLNVKTNH
jgi:hypothetical protein